MSTATREVKYSYKAQEFKIAITALIIFLGYLLMFNQSVTWTPNDSNDLSVIIVMAIIWGSQIYNWTIWKLAGGYKE